MSTSDDLQAFRAEVKEFIETKLPEEFKNAGGIKGPYDQASREQTPKESAAYERWRNALKERGWLAPSWPSEFGGAALDPAHQYVLTDELIKHDAPLILNMGLSMIGPTIIAYGTDDQKRRMLPPILNGEDAWCELFSEPGSGSDLGSLRTRAIRKGDHYVINGQKIWTSEAPYADYGLLMARTDPEAPKHQGISMFRVNMKAPGVTVRPIMSMLGSSDEFNEVFFEDVHIAEEDLIGEENRGWYYLMSLLDTERSAISQVAQIERTFESLLKLARDPSYAPVSHAVRTELADRKIEIEVLKGLSDGVAQQQAKGLNPSHEAAVLKLFHTELAQRLANTAMKIVGLNGLLYEGEEYAPFNGRVGRHYLYASTLTIQVGTSEVQRNIIATRGLGLPR